MKKIALFLLILIGYQSINAHSEQEQQNNMQAQKEDEDKEAAYKKFEQQHIQNYLSLLAECREKAVLMLEKAKKDALENDNKSAFHINKEFQDLKKYLEQKTLAHGKMSEIKFKQMNKEFAAKFKHDNLESYQKRREKKFKKTLDVKNPKIHEDFKTRYIALDQATKKREQEKYAVGSPLKLEECRKKCNAQRGNLDNCAQLIALRLDNIENFETLSDSVDALELAINELEFLEQYGIGFKEFYNKTTSQPEEADDSRNFSLSKLVSSAYSGISSLIS